MTNCRSRSSTISSLCPRRSWLTSCAAGSVDNVRSSKTCRTEDRICGHAAFLSHVVHRLLSPMYEEALRLWPHPLQRRLSRQTSQIPSSLRRVCFALEHSRQLVSCSKQYKQCQSALEITYGSIFTYYSLLVLMYQNRPITTTHIFPLKNLIF